MKYLLVATLAWLLAQSTKRVLNLLGYNKRVFRGGESTLFLSGGMPSGHSATVVALSMSIGLMESFDTTVFAISGILAVIVMYDAMKVRYSSGVQGDTINSLIKEQKSHNATSPILLTKDLQGKLLLIHGSREIGRASCRERV